MLFPLLVLFNQYISIYNEEDDTLPDASYYLTWLLVFVSGFFFTLGSLAFVRAFEEPALRPIFDGWKHAQTDELLAAWLFLFGTAPIIPYALVYLILFPDQLISIVYLLGAIAIFYATYLFVVSCYPSEKVSRLKLVKIRFHVPLLLW